MKLLIYIYITKGSVNQNYSIYRRRRKRDPSPGNGRKPTGQLKKVLVLKKKGTEYLRHLVPLLASKSATWFVDLGLQIKNYSIYRRRKEGEEILWWEMEGNQQDSQRSTHAKNKRTEHLRHLVTLLASKSTTQFVNLGLQTKNRSKTRITAFTLSSSL